MKVLIAEDDPVSSMLLQKTLEKQGCHVTAAGDGQEAMEKLEKEHFDAVLTDWMMPRMDGISLINWIRKNCNPSPLIMVITSLAMTEAKIHALESGADDFITKPYNPKDVIAALVNLVKKRRQVQPEKIAVPPPPRKDIIPPFPAVIINANTGGPTALNTFFHSIIGTPDAAFLVILDVPLWALEIFAMRLQKQTKMRVLMMDDGMLLLPSRIYIARKDQHVTIEPENHKLVFNDDPPVNFCRPSADVLLSSAVKAFGKYTVGITLTGIGKDGLSGLSAVAGIGGHVLTQEPGNAEAPYLPQSVVDLNISKAVLPLDMLGNACESALWDMGEKLSESKNATSQR